MPVLESTLSDRLPPQNLEAEASVLGAALIDKDAIDRTLEILAPSDFYRPAHQKIFKSIQEIHSRNEAVDLVTVTEALRRSGDLETVGGPAFLAGLANQVPSAANVEYYAGIVRDKSRLRRLIATCQDIVTAAYQHKEDASLVVDVAETRILEVGREEGSRQVTQLSDLMMGVVEKIEEYSKRKGQLTGLATGFRELDEKTTGLQKGDMIVVGGRPGMGKTAFCLNIARNVAVDLKKPVAVFSLEMSAHQLAMRMVCAEERVDAHRVRSGRLSDRDRAVLIRGAGRLHEAPFFIDDSPRLDIQQLRARARRLWKERNIALVVIDYLQLLDAERERENRQEEIARISRGVKALAKELQIPVLVASQLARASEKRGEHSKPRLSDLRESGAIEQDADLVLLLYRKGYYDPQSGDRTADFDIAKQRNGPTGEFQLVFNQECTRFEELDSHRQGEA